MNTLPRQPKSSAYFAMTIFLLVQKVGYCRDYNRVISLQSNRNALDELAPRMKQHPQFFGKFCIIGTLLFDYQDDSLLSEKMPKTPLPGHALLHTSPVLIHDYDFLFSNFTRLVSIARSQSSRGNKLCCDLFI